jgi:hypothetical protein
MSPTALVQLFSDSMRAWRIAQGSATERVEQSGPDGGPIQIGGQVGFYAVELPMKQPIPSSNGHSEAATAQVWLPRKGG